MLSTSDFGLINQLLQALGFGKVNFLGDANIAMMCIIGVSVWQWAGWTMTIYLANLQGIPSDFYESASIDGATRIQKFRYVTLPMLFPAVSFCVVTGMINGLKVFDIIYALTSGGPGGQTESIISIMMRKGFTEGFYGYASSMGTVFFLVIVLMITGIQMKYFNKWGGIVYHESTYKKNKSAANVIKEILFFILLTMIMMLPIYYLVITTFKTSADATNNPPSPYQKYFR